MKNPLSAWMKMGNKESLGVRRKQHKLEWRQLFTPSVVTGKGVCYLQCTFLVTKVRKSRMQMF